MAIVNATHVLIFLVKNIKGDPIAHSFHDAYLLCEPICNVYCADLIKVKILAEYRMFNCIMRGAAWVVFDAKTIFC